MLETGDACCALIDHDDFVTLFDYLPKDPRVKIVGLTAELLEGGVRLLKARPDKD